MPLIPLLAGLAQFVPGLLHLFGASSTAQEAAKTAGQIATTVVGITDPQAAVQAIQNDPKLQEAYQNAIAQKMAEMAAAQGAVNTTMATEDKTGRGWWREACGWCVAGGSMISILAVCYLYYVALVRQDPQALTMVVPFTMAITSILMVPGAAVGITAWHAGKVAQINASASS